MASPSASNRGRECKYNVFISFRGQDTCSNFTSRLHAALCRKKIETFIDYEHKRGEEISPALLTAIEESSVSIVILSKNYASSSCCLDQLLKIIECKNTKRHIIIPVFYHVTPSDVRKQTGSYEEAFAKHEKHSKTTKEKVRGWRAALTQVANLSGWDLQQHNGPESELVENIVNDILKKLNHTSSSDLDGLVGIESRIKRVESLLCIGMADVRIIGIWGMGGIGKTTLAKAMFDQLANQFEACCFLANVREESTKRGLNRLQEELLFKVLEGGDLTMGVPSLGLTFTKNRLRRKKVLIVLDDVDNSQQLKFFAGDHGWFGNGSRIIITSRDKQVLMIGVDELYELEKLNYHESLQLFCLNAFRQNHPTENYMELSSRVIYYAQGIPLGIKVLGCFLFRRSKLDWKSALKKLEKNPNMDIQNILKISFDGLDNEEKEIFLDIVCFFKGEDKDHVVAILDGCGFSTEIGISVLVDRCLITVISNRFLMHDLIQEMGRGIVRQESIKEPGKRSRLWEPQDIYYLFKKNTGTQSVESISLDLSKITELHLTSDAFVRMDKLRLLKFYSSHYREGYDEDDKVHLSEGLEFLSDELRYLYWHRYPLKSLPSKFNPANLVELDMHHSNVEYLWKESQNLVNLRWIDLSCSQHLIETPDLSLAPNLENITIKGCSILTKFPEISWRIKKLDLCETAIEEVPSAIECLYKLHSLKLMYCTRLKNLPSSIHNLTSLMELDLHGCSNITKFPDVSGDLKNLYLNETAIEEVPSSVGCLTKLNTLSLGNCTRLTNVSSSIFKLKSLEIIYLFGCLNLEALPEILETMEKLETLDLQGSGIKELPSSIEKLTQLSLLYLANCRNIASLPNGFLNLGSLSSLVLSGCSGVDKLLDNLPLSLLSAEWNCQQSFTFSNCLELTQDSQRNILSEAQLRIQVMATNARGTASAEDYLEWNWPGASVSVCFPGSKIPEWFNYQNVGSSVTFELPQHWCSTEFLGFALCVVVAFDDYNDYKNFNIECKCHFENNDGESNSIDCHLNGFKAQKKLRSLYSDHVFQLYDHRLYSMVVERDNDDNWFSMYQCCHKALFEFSPVEDDRWPLLNCKVKKCGVSLLYLEEERKENGDSSNEAEHVESGSDGNSREDPNSQTSKDFESNSETDAFWLCKIFMIGIALFFFLWFFFGIAIVR